MAAARRRLIAPAFAAAFAASLAIATPNARAASCPGADAVPLAASITVARDATLCLLNAERAARGLAPLASQTQLEGAATSYSRAMVQQHFFSHVSPTGETLQQRLRAYIDGVQTWDVGENLAWGEGSYATPQGIVGGWMRSDGHRANILSAAFREIGIGIVIGTPNGSAREDSASYTTDFGSRETSASDTVTARDPAAGTTAASASTTDQPATRPAARKPASKVSASTKRRIKARCASAARRTRSSPAARTARAASCVRQRLRAAARR